MLNLEFTLLHLDATLPKYSNEGDIGLDISACEDGIIHPHSVGKVSTGLAFCRAPYVDHTYDNEAFPQVLDMFSKIEGRSGLASSGIWPVGGIIDPSYRGIITPIMYNSSDYEWYYSQGARIAQLVFYLAGEPSKHYCNIITRTEVTPTERGDRGFGNSGI